VRPVGRWKAFYLATCDLERCDISLPRLDVLHPRPNLVNDAAEFVAEDVALVHLDDGAMQQMEVTSTNCSPRDLHYHVLIFYYPRSGDIDWYFELGCTIFQP
jgi:hypothetical protein